MLKKNEKSQNLFEWLWNAIFLKKIDHNSKLHIFLYRVRWLFRSDPNGWLYNAVNFYRSYEPKWLAKLTDPSYAFQCQIDNVIDDYLKEKSVRHVRGVWCDPGLNTEYRFYIREHDWTEEDIREFKNGLERAIFDIWGYSNYRGAWKQNALHFSKYCNSNWQNHFCHSFIDRELYGDYEEFCSEAHFKEWREDLDNDY